MTGPTSRSDSPPSAPRIPGPAEQHPPSPFLPGPAWQWAPFCRPAAGKEDARNLMQTDSITQELASWKQDVSFCFSKIYPSLLTSNYLFLFFPASQALDPYFILAPPLDTSKILIIYHKILNKYFDGQKKVIFLRIQQIVKVITSLGGKKNRKKSVCNLRC